MLRPFFHAWERRLAAETTNRVERPFEWGLDWLPGNGHGPAETPEASIGAFADRALAESETFFTAEPTNDYRFDRDGVLRFPSALTTPHPANNVVHARLFEAAKSGSARKRAVVVLPQWNADREGHIGLSRLLARFGITALRLSLPYHDDRMPPELHRADYIVSANIGRTLQVCRQAVLDTRRALDWLAARGYERLGVLGTSLGSCLAMLTAAHDTRVRAAALNHVSPYFGDVVWEGLSTTHIRRTLEGHVDLAGLRRLWAPISPRHYLGRVSHARILLVYAKYDLTFPVQLSRELVEDCRGLRIDYEAVALPCGHYSSGVAPFKWFDGYVLTRFLSRSL